MSSAQHLKILGRCEGQNIQNLIALNILQSLDGRRHNGSEHISFIQPKISIHTTAANNGKHNTYMSLLKS